MSVMTQIAGWLQFQYHRFAVPRWHRERLASIRRRERKVQVLMFAMNIPMWRYQHLYDALCADGRFEVHIALSPSISYDRPSQVRDLEAMRQYFDARAVPYIDFRFDRPRDLKREFDPDLVFYPQPYEHLLVPQHDCVHYYDRLVCYYPYGFWTSTGKWSYDFRFHNLAWRLYYSTTMHLAEARRVARNHGANVRVVGYPNADDFLTGTHADRWKLSDRRLKRIIWAPHYAIADEFGLAARSNFLWMAQPMLQLARTHTADLQIAFKPHPRLLTELYNHPDWGQERADNYYRQWATGGNTMLETGDYVDLFMTSDAMIHDSGSFVVEYHYTGCPVMFISQDMEQVLSTQSEFGREAYRHCYVGANTADIERFINNVVLAGVDPMRAERERFRTTYLMPPAGKTVAQATVDDIVQSLYGDK